MEKRLCAECEGNGKVLAMCSDCNGTGYAIASPAPEAPPQTFEEWWDEARRLFFPDIADGVELTRIKNGALAGWNAAKASSPAAKKEHEPLEWGTNCPQAPDRGPHECAGNDATCVHSGKQGHVCLRCGCYCLCQWCNEGNLRIRSSVSERLVHTDTPVGRVACIDQPSSPPVAGGESELADRIVADLFINGNQEKASRLVLELADGSNGGGWCRQAVMDVIATHLRASRQLKDIRGK